MNALRNSFLVRCLVSFMVTSLISQVCFPTLALALTSGPSQPEVQSFKPANTTDMVNLFTGDFSYNIPLFELPGPNGGYPFNLAYNSGIGLDQEASWVGLGWTLNPGALNREMRGLPDDFNGDQITRQTDMLTNYTYGLGGSAHKLFGTESFGFDPTIGIGLGLDVSIFYNSYNGIGYSLDPSANYSIGNSNDMTMSVGLGLSLNSQEGIGFNPSIGLSQRTTNYDKSVSIGTTYNSNAGLSGMNFNVSKYRAGSFTRKGDASKNESDLKSDNKGHWKNQYTVLGASYGFETPSYVPRITTPTQSRNISISFMSGQDVADQYLYLGISGFFTTQYIRDKTISKSAFGYLNMQNDGSQQNMIDYNRSQDGQILKNTPYLPAPFLTQDVYTANAQGMSAMYRPQRSDLGIIYDDNNQSQSWGGSLGGEFAMTDFGPVDFFHFGMDLNVNYSTTTSGAWINDNDFSIINGNGNPGFAGFSGTNPFSINDAVYEPSYFKVYGEMTAEPLSKLASIGGYEPYRVSLNDHVASASLETDVNDASNGGMLNASNISGFFGATSVNYTTYNQSTVNTQRKIRTTSVIPFKNNDISAVNGGDLAEFNISYFTAAGANYQTNSSSYASYDALRSGLPQSHIGAFVTTNPNGMKYVYGLPAYNFSQYECQFSVSDQGNLPIIPIAEGNPSGSGGINQGINYKVSGTNQYFNRVKTPQYAHSYLLTAVLGADYIDADGITGPSAGDLGYWVKFSYARANPSYNWRTPFTGANYSRGSNTTGTDDIGIYMYGQKEVWHLATAETQTHVAVFSSQLTRYDASSAYQEVQNSTDNNKIGVNNNIPSGQSSFELDQITLYTRDQYVAAGASAGTSGTSLLTVNFKYSYNLCSSVPNFNSTTVSSGKLTLEKLWFTYGQNTRGSLSPYIFDYHETIAAENPAYQQQAFDRWGTYRPYDPSSTAYTAVPSVVFNTPYTPQFSAATLANAGSATDVTNDSLAFRTTMNTQASVWCLKGITLPSGGIISVSYEADDYAYVQNKTATQMFPITGMGSTVSTLAQIPNFIGFKGSNCSTNDLQVYFPLENPLPSTASAQTVQAELQKYLPDNNQLYFNIFTNFSTKNQNNKIADYVTGYADINTSNMGVVNSGAAMNTIGYITLNTATLGNSQPYHPFSLAAWLHVRTQAPYLLNIGGMHADPNTNDGNKTQKLRSLYSTVTEVKKVFAGTYAYCDGNQIGEYIDLSRSFIRLKSPDKTKIGGGCRVKQIVLSDNWSNMTASAEANSYYGQVYSYTIDEDGKTISSGVASNEPQIGNDESPLHSTQAYVQKVPLRKENRLTVEFPINEAYYPAASVGYRQVTVKSIASSYTNIANNPYSIASGILKSGAVTYNFYTFKDFPVVEKYTNTLEHPFNLPLPIPFVGRTDINFLTMSQGYYIELNDMHGKLEKVTNYSLDNFGNINPQPVSYTQYNYQSTPVYNTSGNPTSSTSTTNANPEIDHYVLNNQVTVLLGDTGLVIENSNYYLGQDVEFFTDMRQSETVSFQGGGNFNLEMVIAYFPPAELFVDIDPAVQPQFYFGDSRCRTAVSNKIVHKSGIISSVVNYNLGSTTTTKYSLFDPYTGQPLLSTVTNNYDDPVYGYQLPAHLVTQYNAMGGKYMSQRLQIDLTNSNYTITANTNSVPNASMAYTINNANLSTNPWGAPLLQNGDKVFITSYSGTKPYINMTPNSRILCVISQAGMVNSNWVGTITPVNPAASFPTTTGTLTIEMFDPGFNNNFDETAFSVTALQDPTNNANRTSAICYPTYTYPVDSVPCSTVATPAPCMNVLLGIINTYISTAYGTNYAYTSSTALCDGTTTGKMYNTGGSTGQLFISPPSNQYYDICFYDANGIAIDLTQVASLNTPSINYTGGLYPTTNNTQITYSYYQVNVNLKNGTNVTAYIWFHYFIYSKGIPGCTGGDACNYTINLNAPIGSTTVCTHIPLIKPGTLTLKTYTLNKVLNVSAGVFSPNKPLDNNSLESKNIPLLTTNTAFDQLLAYLNGSAGKFRPKETWTYLDNRSQTAPVNLRTDGVFNNVPIFKFNSPLCKGCPNRWKRVVMYSDYFPSGTPEEQIDVLGNRSAVLFGYSGAQVTATAPNASVYQIGFDGFEDYPVVSPATTPSLQSSYVGKGNLNFYTASMTRTMDVFANYNILSANQNMIVIDMPYNTNTQIIYADVDGQDLKSGAYISGRYTVSSTQASPGDATKTLIYLNTTALSAQGPWMGNGKFKINPYTSTLNLNTSGISSYAPVIVNNVAHTGNYSLTFAGVCTFEQRRLVIPTGTKMVFECWATANPAGGTNAGITFFDQNGNVITADNITFGLSPVTVEGWTKIYGEFTMPAGAATIGITLNGGNSQNGHTPGSSYFDDIRIYPYTSNMVSYVYDPSNYRLKATLDNNNFATYYYYDPSGSLYLTKRETERGIMTIQETQAQVKAK